VAEIYRPGDISLPLAVWVYVIHFYTQRTPQKAT